MCFLFLLLHFYPQPPEDSRSFIASSYTSAAGFSERVWTFNSFHFHSFVLHETPAKPCLYTYFSALRKQLLRPYEH